MVQKVLLKKILAELILTRLIFARHLRNFKNNKVNFRAVKYDIGKCFKTVAYIVYYVLQKTFLSFIFGFLLINKRAFFHVKELIVFKQLLKKFQRKYSFFANTFKRM